MMAFHVPEADYRAFGYADYRNLVRALERELQRGKGNNAQLLMAEPSLRGEMLACARV
jgi:hypothetical protein